MKNSVVSRLSQGLSKVADTTPVVMVQTVPDGKTCDVNVRPTTSKLIDSSEISKGATMHVELVIDNTLEDKTARVVIGSRAGLAKSNELYNLRAETATEVYAQNSNAVNDQGGDAVVATQEFCVVSAMGGFMIDSIEIFAEDPTQLKQSASILTLTPNYESKEQRLVPTKINADVNYAVIENCLLALDAYNGLIYPVLKEQKVTIVIHYIAQGVTTHGYSSTAVN